MSRLVLPFDSHDSTSPSRLVNPRSLRKLAGVSLLVSFASRSRNSLGPSLPIYLNRGGGFFRKRCRARRFPPRPAGLLLLQPLQHCFRQFQFVLRLAGSL